MIEKVNRAWRVYLDIIKQTNIHIMWGLDGEERGRESNWRNNGWKHLKLDEKHEYKRLRSSVISS